MGSGPCYSIRLLSQGAGKASGWEPLTDSEVGKTGSLWKILSGSLQERAGNVKYVVQCRRTGKGCSFRSQGAADEGCWGFLALSREDRGMYLSCQSAEGLSYRGGK